MTLPGMPSSPFKRALTGRSTCSAVCEAAYFARGPSLACNQSIHCHSPSSVVACALSVALVAVRAAARRGSGHNLRIAKPVSRAIIGTFACL
eukprot:523794-Pleurochrysis_carterae.AAC.1